MTTLARFDTEEKRDWRGRWAKGSSELGGKAAAYLASVSGGKLNLRELNEYDTPAYKREHLDPLRAGLSLQQDMAIDDYQENSFQINETARRHLEGELPQYARQGDQISSAARPLPESLVVLRSVSDSMLAGFEAGDVIADDGFSSTTLRAGPVRRRAGRQDDHADRGAERHPGDLGWPR